MANSVLFSNKVIETLMSLPEDERLSVTHALVGRMLLGNENVDALSPMEKIIYSMLSINIRRDSARYEKSLA